MILPEVHVQYTYTYSILFPYFQYFRTEILSYKIYFRTFRTCTCTIVNFILISYAINDKCFIVYTCTCTVYSCTRTVYNCDIRGGGVVVVVVRGGGGGGGGGGEPPPRGGGVVGVVGWYHPSLLLISHNCTYSTFFLRLF